MKRLLDAAVFGVCMALGAVRLALCARLLRRSKHLIIMWDGGFGHTVSVIEAVRRLFAGEHPVVLVFSAHPFHNPYLGALWRDVHVLHLPLAWNFRLGSRLVRVGGVPWWLKPRLQPAVAGWLRRWTTAEVISHDECYDRIEARYPADAVKAARRSLRWVPGWWALVSARRNPVYLPDRLRRRIHGRLEAVVPGCRGRTEQPQRICCLYLRGKEGSLSSQRRVGSPPEAYLPAVELLIAQGYTVLVTGDREVTAQQVRRTGGRLVPAWRLGVDAKLFSLFAQTEADIWIGDFGGGAWLPIINGIPMLVVNAFPPGNCTPGAWMYYKAVRDPHTDRIIPWPMLMRDAAYDHELPEMEVLPNSADEITAAVETFLCDVEASADARRGQAEVDVLPDYALMKHVESRFSPAWLRAGSLDAADAWNALQLGHANP